MHADGDTPAPEPSREQRREERRERRRARTRRFVERYEQRRQARLTGEVSPWWRPVRITAGVLLILGGFAIGWLPGPGFVILAIPGAFLIASEWHKAAQLMDHLENVTVPRMKRLHARLRGGPRHEWVLEDPEYWAEWCEARGKELPVPDDERPQLGLGDRDAEPTDAGSDPAPDAPGRSHG